MPEIIGRIALAAAVALLCACDTATMSTAARNPDKADAFASVGHWTFTARVGKVYDLEELVGPIEDAVSDNINVPAVYFYDDDRWLVQCYMPEEGLIELSLPGGGAVVTLRIFCEDAVIEGLATEWFNLDDYFGVPVVSVVLDPPNAYEGLEKRETSAGIEIRCMEEGPYRYVLVTLPNEDWQWYRYDCA